jgi:hypothetical protein
MMGLFLTIALAQDLDRLLERLDGDDIAAREEAAVALSSRPEAREILAPRRTSNDPERARLARVIVGRIDWEPYLPFHAWPREDAVWARLGSPDAKEVVASLDAGILRAADYGLGLARKFQDSDDDELRQALLAVAPMEADAELLKRWASELPEDAFKIRYGDLVNQIDLRFAWKERPLDVPFWTELLKSPVPPRRYLAACVLGSWKNVAGLDALRAYVGDRERADRAIQLLVHAKHAPARVELMDAACRADGPINALWAMHTFGWDGALDRLQAVAARGDDHHAINAHVQLLGAGDRSRLPALIESLKDDDKSLLFSDGRIGAALLYDTEEAVNAVIARLDKVERWGAHGVDYRFRFGPVGTRMLWERLEREKEAEKNQIPLFLLNFVEPKDLIDRARAALKGAPPARLRAVCAELLRRWWWEHEPGEEDVALMRSRLDDPDFRQHLLRRRDPVLLKQLREAPPSLHTAYALTSYDDPSLKDFYLKHARNGDPSIRAQSIKGLARYPGPETAEAVAAALVDVQQAIREAGLEALSSLPPSLFRGHAEALEAAFRRTPGNYYGPAALKALPPERAGRLAREALDGPQARAGYFEFLQRAPEPGDVALARRFAETFDVTVARPALALLARLDPPSVPPFARRGLAGGDYDARITACELLGGSGGAEAARMLAHVAWNDRSHVAAAAVRALAGRPEAGAFVRRCAAEAAGGRVAPEAWPLLAGPEQIPALFARVERGPDLYALRALDRLLHRESYDALASPLDVPRKAATIEEASRALASAVGATAAISPALLASLKDLRSEHSRDKAPFRLRGRLEEILSEWEPYVSTSSNPNSRFFGVFRHGVSWAAVLDGRTLHFLTPEEARTRLLRR